MNQIQESAKFTDVGDGDIRPVLPPEQPLSMPVQDFWQRAACKKMPAGETDGRTWTTLFTRIGTAGFTLVVTAAFAWGLHGALSSVTTALLLAVLIILSSVCFAWVAFGSATALAGVFGIVRSGGFDTLELPAGTPELRKKTALLFPVYHEDPARIAACIEAMAEQLWALGRADAFDFFVISDTRTEGDRLIEYAVFTTLHHKLASNRPVYYRNRPDNAGKKAGNIKEWISRFGGGYDHFVVFDADSLMSGSAVVRLSAAMEQNDSVGLIQTVPRLVGGQTIFARLQQFATGFYGPLVASGYAMLQGSSGNYWGHNAIIRTKAFAECAGLPKLPGVAPLGGYIQSHDFVEAALLRRSGWGVHMVTSMRGSYEGCPPAFGELAARDRRWMQGNLQHCRILGAHGFSFLSRLHLGLGAFAYLASGLWAAASLVGLWLTYRAWAQVPDYFPGPDTLFPVWPTYNSEAALNVLIATLVIVFLPKFLGLALALTARNTTRYRSKIRVFFGWIFEVVLSTLLAPVMMLTQLRSLAEILAGKDSGWNAQQRDGQSVTLRGALRWHRWHVVVGALLAVVSLTISWHVALWMSPILLGLILSPVLNWWTAKPAGRLLGGLLATDEDGMPPAIEEAAIGRFPRWHRVRERLVSTALGPVKIAQ